MSRVVDITDKNDTATPYHLVEGRDALAVAIRHRLLTIKGEVILHRNYGVAWFRNDTGFIVQNEYIPDLVADIQSQIAQEDDVERVDLVDVYIETDGQERRYVINYSVNNGSTTGLVQVTQA